MSEIDREERAIYLIVLAACAPIVTALAIRRGYINGGNTLILILVALGFAGLFAGARTLRRVPRTRGRLPVARAKR